VRRAADIHRVATQGAEAFLAACGLPTVKRAVYTSSVAALGVSRAPDVLVDERGVLSGPAEAYTEAKVKSQHMIEAARGLPIIITLPSTVIGPNDYRTTPSNHMVVRFASQPNFAYIDGGINVVDVDDVVEGHLQAWRVGRCGERYILAGENVTVRELMTRIACLVGRRPPVLRLGRGVVYPLAVALELGTRATGWRAPISRMQAKTRIGAYGFYSTEKARTELGFLPRPLDEALPRAIDWLRSTGALKE
jgi:dihydroflavonol-4-reductase